jgi:hypothetical protein
MKNKTQMISVKFGILYLYRKFFNFLFLFFFFPYLHSQNISTNDSDIATQEKVIVSTNDSIKTKNNKGLLYISGGAIIYSINNISNAEFKKTSESQNKTIYSKQSTQIAKKVSRKSIEEKKHKVKNVPFTKINFRQKNEANFSFSSSIKNEIISLPNSTQNFIFENGEKTVILNNYNLEKPKTSYNSTFSYFSFLSYICVRPPPVLV